MTETELPFFARLWLALIFLFRLPFDGVLAARVKALGEGAQLPEPPKSLPLPPVVLEKREAARRSPDDAALSVLSLFQREGRLVDFLKQDITDFPDSDVGAAARVVHEGCRRALLAHFEIDRVRTEPEGATVTIPEGFDGASIKLTGDVKGHAPYRGVLRHAGWRVRQVRLPELVEGYDATVVAAAEVEL